MKTALGGIETLSPDLAVVQAYRQLETAVPSDGTAVTIAVDAPGASRPTSWLPSTASGRRPAPCTRLGPGPRGRRLRRRTATVLPVGIAMDASDDRLPGVVADIRDTLVPRVEAALVEVPGAEVHVGGQAAATDLSAWMDDRLPWVVAFVLVLTLLVMTISFGSPWLAVATVALNVLSVGAAYGLMTLVFQGTWAEGVLAFSSTGAIAAWLPMLMFVILFGLSMDYHVFVTSRVREAYAAGHDPSAAVRLGVARSAGVVTSAAAVMVGVFSIFGTLSSLEMKQLGVGLATAVLLDATLVRGVLLPGDAHRARRARPPRSPVDPPDPPLRPRPARDGRGSGHRVGLGTGEAGGLAVASRLQPDPRQGGSRDARDGTGIPLDPAEAAGPTTTGPGVLGLATRLGFPGLAGLRHLLVRPADEVPPHDDVLTERLTPQHEHPRSVGSGDEQHRPGWRHAGTTPSSARARSRPSRVTEPVSTSTDTSNPSATGTCTALPASSTTSAPTRGDSTRTGDVEPHIDPTNTCARTPGATASTSGSWCSKRGSTSATASGSTSHSCAPWRTDVPAVDTSECEMPRPAVMRLTSPGRTTATVPSESRCSTSPLNSHDTVASPQCGCGATSIPPLSATSSGP